MVGMRARARQLGGELTVESPREGGLRIRVEVPVKLRSRQGETHDKKIRVLLADDHAILRKGVGMSVNAQPDMEVVGEAKTGREAIQEAIELKPDIVVMDVSMPDLNGIEGTRQICEQLPHAKVIGLSMHRDSVYVREILRAGARGYLLKDSDDDDLLRAIRAVSRGEAFLSPAISDAVLSDLRETCGESSQV